MDARPRAHASPWSSAIITVIPHRRRSRLYLIAFALLGTLAIGSSVAAVSTLASTFASRGCDLERRGELLGGQAMPGALLGEVRFEVECREFGDFQLEVLVTGSAELAAAIEVEVRLGDDLLYRGPLPELAVTERLAPGGSEIIVRSALAPDYGGGGRISLELVAQVAGI